MKKLLENQENTSDLVKRQTSVVETTLNILKGTTDEVNSNFRSMNTRIENITQALKESYYVYTVNKFFYGNQTVMYV